MSETTDEVVHTHILIDKDDLFVLSVKTQTVEVDWVELIEELKDKDES